MNTFESLGVCKALIDKLAEREIREPSEVQARLIPVIAAGNDIAFRSATGTGKTFAFLLPLLQKITTGATGAALPTGSAGPADTASQDAEPAPETGQRGPVLAIIAPTYELCAQIKGEADFLLAALPAGGKCALLTGDANMSRQIDRLKKEKPRVIVGTPGRMIQLERMGKLKLRAVRYLVLDEADRLMAEEAKEVTDQLVALLPADRQTVACSATLSAELKNKMAAWFKKEAGHCSLDDAKVLQVMIEHWAFFAEDRKKISTLRAFLLAVSGGKTLVFTDRNGQVGNILGQLRHHGVAATGIYGDMDKVERKKAMDDFRAGRAQVMVTTDLSARGLDIGGVTHIVALDVPQKPENYAHRAGRTARAGKKGIMATIGNEPELRRLAQLEKQLKIVVYPKVLYGGKVRSPEPLPEGEATGSPSSPPRRPPTAGR